MNKFYGTDEVGRGCLFGDVVACTVKVNSEEDLENLGILDSKKLSEKKRKLILENLKIKISEIEVNKVYNYDKFSFCLISKNSEYIDKYNILRSALDCMKESFEKLFNDCDNHLWRIDGNKAPCEEYNKELVVKGDSKFLSIGLASIIAKEFRDHQMLKFSEKYPEYGFEKHKGYGTKLHIEKIKELGALKDHRKSFMKKL